jgi:hypothetical protein
MKSGLLHKGKTNTKTQKLKFQINTLKLGGPKQADRSVRHNSDGDDEALTYGRNPRLNTVRISVGEPRGLALAGIRN